VEEPSAEWIDRHNVISRRSQLGAQGTAALSDDEEEEEDWL